MTDNAHQRGSEMSPDESAAFFALADKFLAIANDAVEDEKAARVSASFMFACARFNAFTAQTQGLQAGEVDEDAVSYFVAEYEKMLRENLGQQLVSKG
ncbi:MAG: DUF3144 domain-containing protein [Pseudomonadota bacterium]